MTIYGISIYVWIIFFIALSISSIFIAIRLIKMLRDLNRK